ncbi:MAG: type II secretion system protein [Clostridia bacterium]|nr:type II secretion system protein [Clostridia bacterium]
MTCKNRTKRAFTLAELMVTIAAMGIVLALVTTFAAATSGATKQRSQSTATLREIDKVNTLITEWFYTFDDTDYKMLRVENAEERYVFDYENDRAVRVHPSEFTIQNKKFNSMISEGIVPVNYQLRYNIDSTTFKRVITAVYSNNETDNKSVTLNYITNIDFDYDATLGILKCIYTYNGVEDSTVDYTYSLVLSKRTGT